MRRDEPLLYSSHEGERYELADPTKMPKAAGFLWNRKMMISVTCRGYATSQFMQPEPAKYSHAPLIEAKTFMQPEEHFYAHYPGRFVYVKDEETGEIFSAPYEPVRVHADRYEFSVGKCDLKWTVEHLNIRVEMTLSLPMNDVVELWTVKVTNLSGRQRKISVYPHFTIGYMSWMNQSAKYDLNLGGIVASSITPYQKVDDYFKNKANRLKDKTFFLCETPPTSFETISDSFEGDGGLTQPSSILQPELSRGEACYECPVAAVQYRAALKPSESREYRFLFGPAFNEEEIALRRKQYLSKEKFAKCAAEYKQYMDQGRGCLQISTPDKDLDNFVNHWMPRQSFYHGDLNRLSTDPQTRNYLQDSMGMSYIKPEAARNVFLTALAQQEESGAMPDGILLPGNTTGLKYINQIPHTDHCVWLPLTLELYLSETADYDLLQVEVQAKNNPASSYTVADRITMAMEFLFSKVRDQRGLSLIEQGDWCDPMNMVGYKGTGVSGWLTVATAYAINVWATLCEKNGQTKLATRLRDQASEVNTAANKYFWDAESGWFSRGITDDGVTFGVQSDQEGKIWLNPQTFAILGGAADITKRNKIMASVEKELQTPFGVQMFAPAYTAMREDVGRVTQKAPGSAENASVYNHAGIFYVHSLYSIKEADRAFQILRKMIPGPDINDVVQRGQLPIFIPNYYRGAWHQFPRTAGKSSQLFNTGTISWAYRCVVEGLCGLRGDEKGLCFDPQLPMEWNGIKVERMFRKARFLVDVKRGPVKKTVAKYKGKELPGAVFLEVDIEEGETYQISVTVPAS